ncbi:GNAT family N-acetyltransferase [Mucilaginibacter lutimaris]|uniref:GNAT family N-acetyltransferase n=1 Tax=Mucilaginibacter lutimaris TaxID=931629 RepID=A0ABW2ZE55_9SPHI
MTWSNLKEYGEGASAAFESLMNHLFERYVQRNYSGKVKKFRSVNGKGGDGGVEAYAEIKDGTFIAVQSKWFRNRFGKDQIDQIEESVKTAMAIRPLITEYIICMPIDITSLKKVTAGQDKNGNPAQQLTTNSGDQLISNLEQKLKVSFPALALKWWLDHDIENELAEPENAGIYKFWFDRETITHSFLKDRFEMAKAKWLGERYVPKLHAQGYIESSIDASMYGSNYRRGILRELADYELSLHRGIVLGNKVLLEVDLSSEDKDKLSELVQKYRQKVESIKEFMPKLTSGEPISPVDFENARKTHAVWKVSSKISDQGSVNLLSRFKNVSDEIGTHSAKILLRNLERNLSKPNKVFLGRPGSGKTHALSHATQRHLERHLPAVIIQAFGTDNTDWGAIMRAALIESGWSMDELFNALECQAIREDRRLANSQGTLGDELTNAPTKVLICVDGLEEATGKWQSWKQRIRECEVLSAKYKRLLFIFSSRDYFFEDSEIENATLQISEIPAEGDIPYQSVIDDYFREYDITISSASIIRGIDSLFALRLFCLAYEHGRLNETSKVNTAGDKLLAERIKNIEAEFAKKLNKELIPANRPVGKAISVIADIFINSDNISHDQLKELILPPVSTFLNGNETDLLINYLAENGILIKTEVEKISDGIPIIVTEYSMTYRSIPEIVIASRVAKRIVNGEITNITDDAFYALFNAIQGSSRPVSADEVKRSRKRIRQEIVNILLHEHGKMIGRGGFISTGLSEDEIFDLRFNAMLKAPESLVSEYEKGVENVFFGDMAGRLNLLRHQILPASVEAENNFGARYLHKLLCSFSNHFERDKIWQGDDRFGSDGKEKNNLRSVILGESGTLELSPYALHDEKPLIYAWCLSTLNQEFRSNLRLSLTKWALVQPFEFAKMITLLFNVVDPQIQEDLASISLALAGRLNDGPAILAIANAALAEVFSDTLNHRNVIVRAGFRSIIERAYQYNLLTEDQVKIARPHVQMQISLIPLDVPTLESGSDEPYPIVHDLSWYVIERSYSGFLRYPDGTGPVQKDQDSDKARELLDLYRQQFPGHSLFAKSWALAAGIGYMRSLGFDRTKGNGMTQRTHGSRSPQFTYEEKYTWLAVSYLKGYLADYVPYSDSNYENPSFVEDYFKIVHVPNPGELLGNQHVKGYDAFNSIVIQESLVHNYSSGDIKDFVHHEITDEPVIDFEKWLYFQESQFYVGRTDRKLIALYHDTTQKDAKEYVYARLEAIACLIPSDQKSTLIDLVRKDPEVLHFSHHFESLMTSPDTDTYANPSDIVWMNWIEEYDTVQEYEIEDDPLSIFYGLVKIASTSVDGETHSVYPSKTVRSIAPVMLNIGNYFLDNKDDIIGYHQDLRNGSGLRQEITLLNKDTINGALSSAGLDLVWFVHLYKSKEHSDNIEDIPHIQRSRKYLVYTNADGKLGSFQFWNETTSTERDRFSWGRVSELEPIIKKPDELTPEKLQQIKHFLVAGGEVSTTNIEERIAASHFIAFFQTDGLIISTASIKKPVKSYRAKVFSKAKTDMDHTGFTYELGYLYTLPRARGKNLSNRLISALLKNLDGEKIFSTTRMNNMQVNLMMKKMGFARIGEPYWNTKRSDYLLLYITTVSATAVPSEFEIR